MTDDEHRPPAQHDYAVGGNPTELVPSALRAYRHFKINSSGQLIPTTQGTDPFQYGWNKSRCLAPDYVNADRNCTECRGTGHTNVRTPEDLWQQRFFASMRGGVVPPLGSDLFYEMCGCVTECAPPNIKCKCGYYASYDPDTDFFADFIRQMTAGGPGWYPSLPPVFGVVEVAGRTLMGSKGVRAQKMRVVALALDEYHVHLSRKMRATSFEAFGQFAGACEVEMLLSALDSLGARYNVPTFGMSVDEMVINFPKPDLSQLIENQE